MAPLLLGASDTVAVEVTVVATLVVAGLVASVLYLLVVVRRVRREALVLARQAQLLVEELGAIVYQAEADIARVDAMVGSAEAISGAVGSASRLVGGAVASPLIKAMAFGSGLVRGAKLVRDGAPLPEALPPTHRRRAGHARPQGDKVGAPRAGSSRRVN